MSDSKQLITPWIINAIEKTPYYSDILNKD
jgi:hypothetical protein